MWLGWVAELLGRIRCLMLRAFEPVADPFVCHLGGLD